MNRALANLANIDADQRVRRPMESGLLDRPVRLVWSEHCFLFCIALALVLAVVPPDWEIPGRRILRQLPLLATLPTVVLCLVGRLLSVSAEPHHKNASVLAVFLPFILLGVWITAGSLHARIVDHWQATFLNLGVSIFAAPAAALIMISSRAPTRLAQSYLRLIVGTAMVIAIGLLLSFGSREIYHEQIFLAIPIAVACALTRRHGLRAWLSTLFFLGIALLSMKNTSYLLALLASLYIATFLWLNGIERAPSIKQLWLHYVALLGAVAVIATVCFLLYFRASYLPSGNIEFRGFTYRAAWQQFLESPLWGTSFSAESIRTFTLYTVGIARNRLPTHSDILDLLANGGLLGILLWMCGYVRVGVFAFRRVLAPRFLQYPWAATAHAFAAISLSAVVVYAFNPILLQPEMAYLVWTTLGFLVGLAASSDIETHAAEMARRRVAAAPVRRSSRFVYASTDSLREMTE